MKLTVISPERSNMLWEPSPRQFIKNVLIPWLKFPKIIYKNAKELDRYSKGIEEERLGKKKQGSTWPAFKCDFPPRLYKLEIWGYTIWFRPRVSYDF